MNLDNIRELARIANENNLESIELSSDNMTVKIKVARGGNTGLDRCTPANYPHGTDSDAKKDVSHEAAPDIAACDIREIKSQMVGVFYAAPSPDSEPYVNVGSKVAKGDVLCIIESMKLMNEITSDMDGEIVRVCVENGQIVEFGQPLFHIKAV